MAPIPDLVGPTASQMAILLASSVSMLTTLTIVILACACCKKRTSNDQTDKFQVAVLDRDDKSPSPTPTPSTPSPTNSHPKNELVGKAPASTPPAANAPDSHMRVFPEEPSDKRSIVKKQAVAKTTPKVQPTMAITTKVVSVESTLIIKKAPMKQEDSKRPVSGPAASVSVTAGKESLSRTTVKKAPIVSHPLEPRSIVPSIAPVHDREAMITARELEFMPRLSVKSSPSTDRPSLTPPKSVYPSASSVTSLSQRTIEKSEPLIDATKMSMDLSPPTDRTYIGSSDDYPVEALGVPIGKQKIAHSSMVMAGKSVNVLNSLTVKPSVKE